MTALVRAALAIQLLAVAPGVAIRAGGQETSGKSRAATAPQRFEKVSDHVYFLQASDEGVNSAAVLSSEGFLLINPPAEPELGAVLLALGRIAARPVRWVVNTDYIQERAGGGMTMLGRGAALLASKELNDLSSSAPAQVPGNPPADQSGKSAAEDARGDVGPRLVFTRQMHLYLDNLEVRIIAVQHKARTAGDVIVFVPAEKVLVTGRFFVSGSFPEFDDPAGGGSALGWIDALKQAIDTVPLLKSAMPPPKPDPGKPPKEEKTLEEQVTVIPGQGHRSDLQEMKDLLETALKLRNEISRAIGTGRRLESTVNSPALAPARSLGNFESFAAALFDELSARKSK